MAAREGLAQKSGPAVGLGSRPWSWGWGRPLTPRNLASQAGTHPQQEGEILSDVKGPARSNKIFNKWGLCQWGSSFTYWRCGEGRWTMFMDSESSCKTLFV